MSFIARLRPFIVFALLASKPAMAGELTVSAASSLTNAFKDLSSQYGSKYPQTKVSLNFGASGALLQQIANGAPVDVFASADQETMDEAEKKNLIATKSRGHFAANTLMLVVPTSAPDKIKGLDDLKKSDVKRVAIGNPTTVPVGRYTKEALERNNLWSVVAAKMIKTDNVRQSLDYVARGEVDAGFVYATDVLVMKEKVKPVMKVTTTTPIVYPIAKITRGSHNKEADRFIEFVLSPAGQKILGKHGFTKP